MLDFYINIIKLLCETNYALKGCTIVSYKQLKNTMSFTLNFHTSKCIYANLKEVLDYCEIQFRIVRMIFCIRVTNMLYFIISKTLQLWGRFGKYTSLVKK